MILEKIAKHTQMRVQNQRQKYSFEEMKKAAQEAPRPHDFPFEQALGKEETGFICEVKKASPSKGVIVRDFPYVQIAREYEAAGAAAISVLTEPEFFMGDSQYLIDIRKEVSIPLLRKDFTIDPYQIYEARTLGADSVLLIAALLDMTTLGDYLDICHDMGLSALVEVHDEREMDMALRAGARIIGVNNRNLKDFSVDITNSIRLRAMVPEGIFFVAESGIKSREDVKLLEDVGADGILLGEALMRSTQKKELLYNLRGSK